MEGTSTEKEHPSVSVVIPAHNAAATLGAQLEALCRQLEPPPFEVVIAANRCTDSTVDVARSFTSLSVRVIVANDRASASYARNVGARHALGERLLFCDADDEVGERWVAELSAALERVDFAGGSIRVRREGLPNWVFQRHYAVLEEPLHRVHKTVLYPISASLGIRRDVFDLVGGFDERFSGAGYEEADLALRAYHLGFRVGVAPLATLEYTPRAGFRQLLRQQRRYSAGLETFASKHGVTKRQSQPLEHYTSIVRRLGYRIVRRHEMTATDLLDDILVRHLRWRALRRATNHVPETRMVVAPLDTSVIGGYGFETHASTAAWYASEGIERLSVRLAATLLRPGDTFIDCGANVGVYSVLAAKVCGHKVEIHCFEPDPTTAPILTRNLSRHDARARVHRCALGSSSGPREFHVFSTHEISGFAADTQGIADVDRLASIAVDTVRLDDTFAALTGFLKIDVEGFETEVLRGAQRLLGQAADLAILVELNPQAMATAGYRLDDLLEHVPASDWRLWLVEDPTSKRQSRLMEVTHAELTEYSSAQPRGWYANLLAIKGERAAQLDGDSPAETLGLG